MDKTRRQKEDERYYDLVYEAWRSGRDPDHVSRDRYADMLARGFEPDEITVTNVLPKRRQSSVGEEGEGE